MWASSSTGCPQSGSMCSGAETGLLETPVWSTIVVGDTFQVSLHHPSQVDFPGSPGLVPWPAHPTVGMQRGTGVSGILPVPSPRNALPPPGCSWGRGSLPAQGGGAGLGHISRDLPWWTRVCSCRFYHSHMVGQRTALSFILRQTSLKGCVLHGETFVVEKA